jgi:hypothetical protein
METYEVTTFYYHKSGSKFITRVYQNDSYENVMVMVKKDLKKLGIQRDKVIGYKPTKIITCLHCGQEIHLVSILNSCVCGACYNSFGIEEFNNTENKIAIT